jgi:hypothetical protein
MFKVVVGVELGDDVGMKLVVDSAACSLAGIIAISAQGQPTARQSPKEVMAGCPDHSTLMRG